MASNSGDTSAAGRVVEGREGDEEEEVKKPRPPKERPKIRLTEIYYNDFNVHVVTWNVASFNPGPVEVESLFAPQEGFQRDRFYESCDIVVVGLQEAYQNVQEAVTSAIPVVGRDLHVEAFSGHLSAKGFVRLAYTRILGIVIMVFVKLPLLCYIHSVVPCVTRTGFGGWVGNKGAVSIRFTLGEVGLCFVNCHLTSQRENNEKRISELRDVFMDQFFQGRLIPDMKPLDHDVVVLFGDMNFRLREKEFEEVKELLAEGKMKELLKLDQLLLEQIRGEKSPSKLCEFVEMEIDFIPSYRYVTEKDEYTDGGKCRVPAWCDRILWRTHTRMLPKMTHLNPQPAVTGVYYCLHRQPRSSDHRAVSAGLRLSLDISSISPPVIFHCLCEWVVGVRGTIEFTVIKGTEISLWDWIGLFPSHFSSLDKDSALWVLTPAQRGRASEDKTYSRELSTELLKLSPGKYVLIYKSYASDRVLGMSPIFSVLPAET